MRKERIFSVQIEIASREFKIKGFRQSQTGR